MEVPVNVQGKKMGHLEGMSSYGAMWQPCSFVGPLLLHSLIWLNWFKSQEKWCHHDRDTWMGGRCSAIDIIMTLALQGNGVRGRSRGSWGVAYALRTSDVAPWEAPIASVENHTVASCPVMIDGETNGWRGRPPAQLYTVKQYGSDTPQQMHFIVFKDR